MDHDAIIIGAGPAGLTAAIYLTRSGYDVLLITGDVMGGKASWAGHIDNYPGFPEGVNGFDLADAMMQQAQKFGAKILTDRVVGLRHGEGAEKLVTTEGGQKLTAYAVVVASGSGPRRLGVPGESELIGRGVSYCATCDGPLFRGKDIVVVGGGNVAVEEAITLARLTRSVKVIHRRDELRATAYVQEEFFALKNAVAVWDSVVTEVLSKDNKVSGVRVRNVHTGAETEIPCEGVFVAIGQVPGNEFLKGMLSLDEYGYVITDEHLETHVPGIFAAGDIRRNDLKQVTVAVGEGSIAAVAAAGYIRKEKGE